MEIVCTEVKNINSLLAKVESPHIKSCTFQNHSLEAWATKHHSLTVSLLNMDNEWSPLI